MRRLLAGCESSDKMTSHMPTGYGVGKEIYKWYVPVWTLAQLACMENCQELLDAVLEHTKHIYLLPAGKSALRTHSPKTPAQQPEVAPAAPSASASKQAHAAGVADNVAAWGVLAMQVGAASGASMATLTQRSTQAATAHAL